MEPHDLALDPDYSDGRTCCRPLCGLPIPNDCVTPMCRPHSLEVGRAVYLQVRSEHESANREQARRRVQRGNEERMRRRMAGEHFVYYVRIEGDIKIGYTKSLQTRMRDYRIDTATALLAIEPGSRPLEQRRHQEFAAERVHLRRENFRPSERLMAHIAALREEHGLPDWALRPDTRAITVRRADT